MEINYTDIGKRVRKARKKKGLTQGQLAEMVDVSPTHISHIENGATKLGLPTIVDIANALDVTVDRLLCDSIPSAKQEFKNEISELFELFSAAELRYLAELIPSAVAAFRHAQDTQNSFTED